MKKTNKLIHSWQDNLFDYINGCLLIIVLVIILFPLIFIINASISDPDMVATGSVWLLPKNITFIGYKKIFSDSSIWLGYKNTIIYTFVGTIINVILTIMAAYPLSRKDFYGKKFFMIMITLTMFFNSGLIPRYLVVQKLGLYDTMWALILPQAVAVWNIIITRTYFKNTIPHELDEAAQIDGCTRIKYLIQVVVPLSKPILAVITLYYAVSHWNNFFSALIYLQDEKLYPLQLILRDILIENQLVENMVESIDSLVEQQKIAGIIKYGVIIVASLPMLILYPFLQKYFVKGVMVGSLKG